MGRAPQEHDAMLEWARMMPGGRYTYTIFIDNGLFIVSEGVKYFVFLWVALQKNI